MLFLKLFYQLAPLLVGRNGSEDMSPKQSASFVQLANEARSRIREITPEELAKVKQLPLIVDVRERKNSSRGISVVQSISVEASWSRKSWRSLLTVPGRFWSIARAEIEVPWRPIV
jgi:hypothetical protein